MMTECKNSTCTSTGTSRLRWRDSPGYDFAGEITCLTHIMGCLVGLGSIGCDANLIQFGKRLFTGGGAGDLHCICMTLCQVYCSTRVEAFWPHRQITLSVENLRSAESKVA